ncbi:DUF3099 domain-containing protein [Microbacterium sp. NPDC078428]|uniref:DUF3099 domain-containing protein n=1 Tax=Microbacterium limosum TaxID=3079935 RepID=A0AAU0ME80_9MICO|nr:DUF3099 domain-containing protein [Microbacterium sp. Y20]WOQ68469.1 DUF3099 domain-containing protein [Microbacterium sp. Y20]
MRAPASHLTSTSLPQSPRDEAAARLRRYAVTMGIRIACFLLMAFVTPYGWWTWVFAAGAILLPYVAVVLANVGMDAREPRAESPERALPGAPESAPRTAAPAASPSVIRIQESPEARPVQDQNAGA